MPSKVSSACAAAGKHGRGHGELGAVPVVLFVERLGDGEVVEAVAGVGIDAVIDQGGEDGAGNGGAHPAGGVIGRCIRGGADLCSVGVDLGGLAQASRHRGSSTLGRRTG